MKKVLSVLLAAAMVMGMSVTSFAKVWGTPVNGGESAFTAGDLFFDDKMKVQHEDKTWDEIWANNTEDEETIVAGDTLYFTLAADYMVPAWKLVKASAAGNDVAPSEDALKNYKVGDEVYVDNKGEITDAAGAYSIWAVGEEERAMHYYNQIDKDWVLNLTDVDYVVSAEFVSWDNVAKAYNTKNNNKDGGVKYIAVKVDADYDAIDEDDIDFSLFISQKDEDTHFNVEKSQVIEVHQKFDNWDNDQYKNHFSVEYDVVNEVDVAAKWISAEKDIALFSFDDEAFFEVKMMKDEEVVLNAEIKSYVKEIEVAQDYEAEYVSYNFKGDSDEFLKAGVLVLPADEETFVYGWDGEAFVELEEVATYVEDHKFDNGKKVTGWMIETNELGWYVVTDTEVEFEVEAEVEAPVEADKANPETGAADFVGAAVAMAVVSVAAAGALALKK